MAELQPPRDQARGHPLARIDLAQHQQLRRRQPRRRGKPAGAAVGRSEEHTSELQSLMRISYAVFCLKKKTHFGKKITQSNTSIDSNELVCEAKTRTSENKTDLHHLQRSSTYVFNH